MKDDVAKNAQMFTDLFVFDQARYYFDLLPAPDLYASFHEHRFNKQLIAAINLDALVRHLRYQMESHFYGCHLFPIQYGDPLFDTKSLKPRKDLSEKPRK